MMQRYVVTGVLTEISDSVPEGNSVVKAAEARAELARLRERVGELEKINTQMYADWRMSLEARYPMPEPTSSIDAAQQAGYRDSGYWKEACRLFRSRCSPEDCRRVAEMRTLIETGEMEVHRQGTGERVGELEKEAEEISKQCVAEVKAKADAWIQIHLLREALRWCCDNGIGEGGWHSGMEPPAHLAPLISEAVKPVRVADPPCRSERSSLGPNGECPICGGIECKPGCRDGSEVL